MKYHFRYTRQRSGHRQPKSILVCCLPAGRQQKGTYFTKSSKSKKRNKKQSRNNAFANKIWNNEQNMRLVWHNRQEEAQFDWSR